MSRAALRAEHGGCLLHPRRGWYCARIAALQISGGAKNVPWRGRSQAYALCGGRLDGALRVFEGVGHHGAGRESHRDMRTSAMILAVRAIPLTQSCGCGRCRRGCRPDEAAGGSGADRPEGEDPRRSRGLARVDRDDHAYRRRRGDAEDGCGASAQPVSSRTTASASSRPWTVRTARPPASAAGSSAPAAAC